MWTHIVGFEWMWDALVWLSYCHNIVWHKILIRSPTIACYAFWKAMELIVGHLTRCRRSTQVVLSLRQSEILTIDILFRQNLVPSLPFFTELVYATSTAVLFQVTDQESQFNVTLKVATLEPHSLSPSYWKFLQRITGGKLGQVRYWIRNKKKNAFNWFFQIAWQAKPVLWWFSFFLFLLFAKLTCSAPFPGQSATGWLWVWHWSRKKGNRGQILFRPHFQADTKVLQNKSK